MTSKWIGARLQPRPSLAEQAAIDLRSAIKQGAFESDGQLPSEPTLSRQLGVSRPTIRQALSLLEQEGLVVRRQGLGTFVLSTAAELRNNLSVNAGITDMIRSAGRRPGTSRISVQRSAADPKIAKQLAISPGTPVAVVERTRTADDRAVALTRDFVRTDLLAAHGVPPEDVEAFVRAEESLYAHLDRVGISVAYGIAEVLPARATEALVEALGVAPDSLLLLLEQTDYTGDGAPILFSEEYLVPGPFAVYVFRRGPG